MKYHNTLGERNFVTILKLGKAGHDMDEVIASPQAEWKRPRWVNTVSKPTVDIDWDYMNRFDETRIQMGSFETYIGSEENKKLREQRANQTRQWIVENRPNYTLRDRALDISVRQGAVGTSFLGFWSDSKHLRDGGKQEFLTPQSLKVPRWEGSPEENARMIRSAMRIYGASQVGFLELDEHNRKLIYSIYHDGKKIDFEDVDVAYETAEKRVIPQKARWVIVFTVQMAEDLLKRRAGKAPTPFSAAATGSAYARARMVIDDLQIFLHCIGYQGLMTANWTNGLGIAPALGVMAGLGELSRLNRLINPEYGPLVRIFRVITDLPLSPTKPIDAGIMRFCRTCKKCAIACPSGTLSLDTEPSWEVKGPWNNPGHKTWYENSPKCSAYWLRAAVACSTCIAVCPFSKKDRSFMNSFVRSTIAKTSLFNSFFTHMDDVCGYDKPKDPESWWDIDLPTYGI
ncbi:MAG: reductive dehalogenase [Chloroflexi bacterium]|nr:reductive dehalogenase [Chloroflexota bacterium]